MKRFFKSGEKGFTLIELLVVISILAVLAAVVVLNVTKYIGAGCTEAAATEMHNIQTAVAAYMYDNSGAAPSSTSQLTSYFIGTPHGTYSIDSGTGEVTDQTYLPCIP
ncbi:MAG: type II secretion system protein [Dehalococcoidia bacterium]|nr:type II secretion system protein [Dehalococcoidia bacterium]MDD5495344.1 type II secretion system protein [Dehalococcoidia bacterium]